MWVQVVAVLFDATSILGQLLNQIQKKDVKMLKSLNTSAFATRLKWLSNKFKNIDRSSVQYKKADPEEKKELDQSSIDDLMKSLGL